MSMTDAELEALVRPLGDLDPTNEPETTKQLGREAAAALTTLRRQRDELREALESLNYPAVKSAGEMLLGHYLPRKCDSDGMSSCINCNTVFLAKSVERARQALSNMEGE